MFPGCVERWRSLGFSTDGQGARLLDVFVLGPALIFAGMKVGSRTGSGLIFAGVAVILYNGTRLLTKGA